MTAVGVGQVKFECRWRWQLGEAALDVQACGQSRDSKLNVSTKNDPASGAVAFPFSNGTATKLLRPQHSAPLDAQIERHILGRADEAVYSPRCEEPVFFRRDAKRAAMGVF